MSARFKSDLFELRRKAENLLLTDNLGNETTGRFRRRWMKCAFLILSIGLAFATREAFSENFLEFTSTALSIIVGLFITALVFSFDKFYKPQETPRNVEEQLWDTKAHNYTKRFTFITGYTTVLSLFGLVLLGVNGLAPWLFKLDITSLYFNYGAFGNRDWPSICLFFWATSIILFRTLVLYLLARIVYNTLFVVSTMIIYMDAKQSQSPKS